MSFVIPSRFSYILKDFSIGEIMIKIDLHVHSEWSIDGRSTLHDLTLQAKKLGLYAIALTDHNRYSLTERTVINGVHVLPGCEISAKEGHIVALFCDTPCDLKSLFKNGPPDAQAVMSEIHSRNGIGIAAHPYAMLSGDAEALITVADCVETHNARAAFKVTDANYSAQQYAIAYKCPTVGASDAHCDKEVGNAYTEFEDADADNLKDAILNFRTKPVLVRNTKRYYKGLSQLKKQKRKGGGLYLYLRAHVYVLYCILLDIFHGLRGE